jgi:hypothetical protein
MISLYAPSMNDDMCFYTKHESINLFIYIKYVWWYVFIHLILLHFLWLFYFTVRSMSWLTFMNIRVTNDNGYVTFVVYTSRSFPHSWLITGFVTRLTGRVPLVKQELLILPEHLSSPPVFSGVRVTRSVDLCVCFVDRSLFVLLSFFGHRVVCPSSIYGFWLPL